MIFRGYETKTSKNTELDELRGAQMDFQRNARVGGCLFKVDMFDCNGGLVVHMVRDHHHFLNDFLSWETLGLGWLSSSLLLTIWKAPE